MTDSVTPTSVTPPAATEHRRDRMAPRRLLPPLATLLVALLTAALGSWQLGRAEEKRSAQAAREAAARLPMVDLNAGVGDWRALYHRRVRVDGRYVAAYQVYVDNRIYRGRAGYHVVAPLRFSGGSVLVVRGWLAARADRRDPPRIESTAGQQTVEGILVPAYSRYLELATDASRGPVWQNLDLQRYRAWYRAPLPDALVLATAPMADGLIRDWPRPDAGVDRHLGYAVQWFALAVASVVLYGYHGIWRRRHETR